MKIVLIPLLLSFQTIAQNPFNLKEVNQEEVLFGKVKSIYENEYHALYDPVKQTYLKDTTHVDRQISRKFDSSTKTYIEDTTYYKSERAVLSLYDTFGNPYKVTSYFRGDTFTYHTAYTYDKKGHIITKLERGPYIDANTYYTYNKKGNLIQVLYADAVGSKEGRVHEIKYNRRNQIIEEKEYATQKTIQPVLYITPNPSTLPVSPPQKIEFLWKYTYLYNREGELIQETRFDIHGNVSIIYTYEYIKANHSTDQKGICQGEICDHTVSYYDTNNRLIELYRDLPDYYSIKYTYDSYGNTIQEVINYTYDSSTEQQLVKEYTYDTQGNWTKVIYLGTDQPIRVRERVIEYY